VALGKPWLGLGVKPCKVLLVDEESGEQRLTLRLGQAIRGELGSDETPLEYVSLASFKLDDKADVILFQALIEDTGAGVVIIDALADIMTGDENSKQDTQPVFSNLRKIAEQTGAALIIIHHSNRTGGYRGSSAIKGALDLMIKIESDDGSNWINFKSEKNRDGEALQFSACATWNETQFYLSPVEGVVRTKTRPASQRYVLDYLEKNGGAASVQEIMDHAEECSPQAARQAIYVLAGDKLIKRVNVGGKGIGAMYELIPG
jgi:hypothetical protein